jgi:hypothetical protein
MPRVRQIRTGAGHNAGEIYEVDETVARILCAPDALGGQMCHYVGDYETRVVVPSAAPEPPEPIEEPPPRKGRYMRRDMRAKE